MAKGKFGIVESRFWEDTTLKVLGKDAKLLMLYLLTCRHKNIVGSFYLPPAYIQNDTGLSDDDWKQVWKDIQGKGKPKISFDETESWVLIENYIRNNPPKGEKQITGAINAIEDMPDNPHNQFLLEQLREHTDGFEQTIDTIIDRRKPELKQSKTKQIQKQLPKEAHMLAELLAKLIMKNDNRSKVPNFTSWVDSIEKINRIDGRSWDEIERVIKWCQADDFWRGNILSGAKLRKQFQQLSIKMNSGRKQNNATAMNNVIAKLGGSNE